MITARELETLWRAHAAALELLARVRCTAPEDCVQEAFIRLAVQPTVPEDPGAWLWKVVRNLAANQSRAVRRRQHHEQQSAFFRKAEWATFGSRGVLEEVDAERLGKAVDELDGDLRDILVATVWGGLTFRQIGEAFEISHAAAHRRYHAALDALRIALEAKSPLQAGDGSDERKR